MMNLVITDNFSQTYTDYYFTYTDYLFKGTYTDC